MQRSRLQNRERALAVERSLKYRGTARVEIEVLYFPPLKTRGPKSGEKNVERLKGVFRRKGVLPEPIPHHIPAVTDRRVLDVALRGSEVSAEQLWAGPPYKKLEFPPDYRLECLRGQSRTLAAAQILPAEERWWIVDLFTGENGPFRRNGKDSNV